MHIMDDLGKGAYAAMAKFLAALALILFLAAGTLTYWQGWAYLLVFGIASALSIEYFRRFDPELLRRRMNAGPQAEQRSNQKVIQLITSLSLLTLYVVSCLDYRFGWSHVPTWLCLVGLSMTVLAFAPRTPSPHPSSQSNLARQS